MKYLTILILLLGMWTPSKALIQHSCLSAPDTVCLDTQIVLLMVNDLQRQDSVISFLKSELFTERNEHQYTKIDRNSLANELTGCKRSKTTTFLIGGLVGLVLGLVISP